MIYDQQLTSSEISGLYQFGLNGTPDDTNVIDGGAGDDTLVAGLAFDSLDGGTGTDTVDYSASSDAVTVNLATGVGTWGDAQGDSYTNIENVIGSDYDDTLTGDANANVLEGGAGADVLDGGAGSDTASYESSSSGVTANLATNSATGGDAQGDTFTSIENLTGSNYNDTLTGDANANILAGGLGNDTLSGGDGSDLFIFQMGDGTDTINGGAGGSWIDAITVQDASGGSKLGTYGVDWTVSLTEGTIDGQDANGLDLSDDADGVITLSDGSIANFFDIERIDF